MSHECFLHVEQSLKQACIDADD